MNMARFLTGKVHVSYSNLQLIRYVRSKMKDPHNTPLEDKKEFYRDCIKEHSANRQLYSDVMGGLI